MFLLLAGIAGGSGPAAAQTASETLARLGDEFWAKYLEMNPTEATALGIRDYDDRLSDNSPEGLARERAWFADILARAQALPAGELNSEERVTLNALITEARAGIAGIDCGLTWVVDPLWGPHVSLQNIQQVQIVRTPAEGRAMVARWRAMGPYLDTHAENVRRGLSEDKVSVRAAVEKALDTLDEMLAKPDAEWALLKPIETERAGWSEAERKEFGDGLRAAVADVVRPAFERYRDLLRNEVLPVARAQDKPGLVHTPGGLDCYRNAIRVHTSLDLSPDELHETGLREVAKINKETEELGKKVFGLSDRQEILKRLRTDKSLYFSNREEVKKKAETALARAKAAIPKWFGILPQAGCVVTPMADYEEKHSTIAYYRQPATDGSRPGQYFINTYAPETRPRYEAEALAYHEAIPGHHLQIAIAQELTDIPEFRKHTGVTAFAEGWALYTERLSDEMGLYSSDLDRIGMLSYDSWRACRLVVDTGMHAKGWTRQQAIDYMVANSALAENNIVNEVDRYITWPGQALAYKTGQLEIFRLRDEARKKLGDRFDIRGFHDAVLSNGAVSLEALRGAVADWVDRTAAGGGSKTAKTGGAR